jgi:hypothetical protein
MYLQSINSVKQNAAKSVNRSTERKADIGFGVFIVYSSMQVTLHFIDASCGFEAKSDAPR